MSRGGCIVLLAGEISLADAGEAIGLNVMLFLFGMFVVGQALEESGVPAQFSIIIQRAERRVKERVTFWEFARVGIPLTRANVVVTRLFL